MGMECDVMDDDKKPPAPSVNIQSENVQKECYHWMMKLVELIEGSENNVEKYGEKTKRFMKCFMGSLGG